MHKDVLQLTSRPKYGKRAVQRSGMDHGNLELRLTNRTSRHANVAMIDGSFPDELWRCESDEWKREEAKGLVSILRIDHICPFPWAAAYLRVIFRQLNQNLEMTSFIWTAWWSR